MTSREDRDALVAALEELAEIVLGYQRPAAEAEDPDHGPKLSRAVSAARNLLQVHLPTPNARAPLDVIILDRALRNWAQPSPLDPDLDSSRTRTRANIRMVRGGLIAALEDITSIACRAFPWVQRLADGHREVTQEERAQIAAGVSALANFSGKLDKLQLSDIHGSSLIREGEVVTFYIEDMRLQIDLAHLHLTVNDVLLDVPALVDVIETIDTESVGLRDTVMEFGSEFQAIFGAATVDVVATAQKVTSGILRWAVRVEPPPAVPFEIRRDAPQLPEMVLIPTGQFVMGIPEEEGAREGAERDPELYTRSRPFHVVTIRQPFWLGRYPVTRMEYAAFVRDTGYRGDGGLWRSPNFRQDELHPVVSIRYDGALKYIEWLNAQTSGGYRLPSEAEWEYAARGGSQLARFWGDSWEGHERYAWTGRSGTAPVTEREPNAYRLHDMLGNVWEWCADPWHANYRGAPTDGSVWTSNADLRYRVARGGSWKDPPRLLRAGVRYVVDPTNGDHIYGFRVARDCT